MSERIMKTILCLILMTSPCFADCHNIYDDKGHMVTGYCDNSAVDPIEEIRQRLDKLEHEINELAEAVSKLQHEDAYINDVIKNRK